jgi:hypothetical protein
LIRAKRNIRKLPVCPHISPYSPYFKSTTTGVILDAEPGEAEWNLDILESLFDFYFVQPALTAKR